MRRSLPLAFALVAACTGRPAPPAPTVAEPPAIIASVAAPSAPAPASRPSIDRTIPAPKRILDEAARILASVKTSRYRHEDGIDEASGRYELDCSGLATYVLRGSAPDELDRVPRDPGEARPRAWQFFTAFDRAGGDGGDGGATGFRKVERLLDARPGDLIAWRKAKIPRKGNTGHVVIVAEPPALEKNGTVRVVVIDSTGVPHAEDTRRQRASGVGRGTMWFTVDARGAPVAYLWSAKEGSPKRVAIAVGRAVDPAPPMAASARP